MSKVCKRMRNNEDLEAHVNISHDNTIFTDIKSKLTAYQIQQVDDFKDIFYYLIINYSKSCYKYGSNWKQKKKTWNKKFIPNFDFEGANFTTSHDDLLEIQKQMITYRNNYNKFLAPKNNMFTKEFVTTFVNFINESLHIFYISVITPIKYINPNIMEKLKYHNNIYIKKPKKSNKINYEKLQELIESGEIDKNLLEKI